METVFDSTALCARDRVAAWSDVAARALVPTKLKIANETYFHAHLRNSTLGIAHVASMAHGPLWSRRTPATIRQSDPEEYQIAFIRSGLHGMEQAGNQARLGPGELVLYDSSRPFDSFVEAGDRGRSGSHSLVLQFPRSMLPLSQAKIARLLAVPLSGTEGMGRLLTQFLSTLAEERSGYVPPDAARLGHIALDLFTAVLSHYLDDTASTPGRSPQSLLFLRITSFIGCNLHDPQLAPAMIASAHHISLRYLHRIFQLHDTTVSAYIKRQRLSRCRRDLADPGLRHLAVHVIASRWGFHRPSDFSRAFRAAVGMSPCEYRRFTESATATPRR